MKTLKYLAILCFSSFCMLSCLDTDLDNQYVSKENNRLDNPVDSIVDIYGLIAQMQMVGKQYIIWGELRGDLLDITEYSDRYLKEINNHNISADNPYMDPTLFYALINNCNYVINHIDTIKADAVLLPDYAVAVNIRAWAYLQLIKNFSNVRYGEKPVENVQDALNADFYPVLSREVIVDKLIVQLEAVKEIPLPARTLAGIRVMNQVPSSYFTLGELYLWKGSNETGSYDAGDYSSGSYEKAAYCYKMLIEKGYICDDYYNVIFSLTGTVNNWWREIFHNTFEPSNSISTLTTRELHSAITYHPRSGVRNDAYNMMITNYEVRPSSHSILNWKKQKINISNQSLFLEGDSRGAYTPYGQYSSWMKGNYLIALGINVNVDGVTGEDPFVYKMKSDTTLNGRIILERGGLINLRYAEAVNRMGKPTLALAALNYGLKKAVIDTVVNPQEVEGLPFVVNFVHTKFNTSMGLRGRVQLQPVRFPEGLTTKLDSICFVEETILEEAALETAFEGNRWGDLVRIALRRINDSNSEQDRSFLANKIATKFEESTQGDYPNAPSANPEAIRSWLSDPANYFIPLPHK